MHRTLQHMIAGALTVTAFVLPAAVAVALEGADPQAPGRPTGPQRIDFAKELNLSPERARKLDAIVQNEMEAHRAARERARAEMAKVLTPDEMAKLDSLMPRPRGPMGPPPERH